MSLYFQKGVTPSSLPSSAEQYSTAGSGRVIRPLLGALLILATAILQALGIFWVLESHLPGFLLPSKRPSHHKTILLTMERGTQGFAAMDLAMALRGLAKLHPGSILIDGEADQSSDSVPLFESVRSRLLESGIEVIEGVAPSTTSTYRPVSLCRYDPPSPLRLHSEWPVIRGSVTGTGSECFLPEFRGVGERIPLLASNTSGDPVGSLWWSALNHTGVNAPLWLICGRLLLFPNHSALLIDSQGFLSGVSMIGTRHLDCRVVPLDDFLLKIEEMERGSVSPGFDSLWENSLVVIAPTREVATVTTIASLRERLTPIRFPIIVQALLTLLWIVLVIISPRLLSRFQQIAGIRSPLPRSLPLLILLAVLVAVLVLSIMGASHGLIIPLVPAVITTLFLMISPGSRS